MRHRLAFEGQTCECSTWNIHGYGKMRDGVWRWKGNGNSCCPTFLAGEGVRTNYCDISREREKEERE